MTSTFIRTFLDNWGHFLNKAHLSSRKQMKNDYNSRLHILRNKKHSFFELRREITIELKN